jgi:ketosteroid isomerase-like protein
MTHSDHDDKAQILQHIHSIFQAYIDHDRDRIRALHTSDWVGFQNPSAQIERGMDAYMVNAESSLQLLKGTGFELLDTEIQLYGDMAVVYYVARYDCVDEDGKEMSLPLRAVDIYRREGTGWNQSGSHICVIPDAGPWANR